jgi:hypothetical protein
MVNEVNKKVRVVRQFHEDGAGCVDGESEGRRAGFEGRWAWLIVTVEDDEVSPDVVAAELTWNDFDTRREAVAAAENLGLEVVPTVRRPSDHPDVSQGRAKRQQRDAHREAVLRCFPGPYGRFLRKKWKMKAAK